MTIHRASLSLRFTAGDHPPGNADVSADRRPWVRPHVHPRKYGAPAVLGNALGGKTSNPGKLTEGPVAVVVGWWMSVDGF